jgi:hypothetical protein
MIENPSDDDWVFDAGNLLDASALVAGFNLEHIPSSNADVEALEP